MSNCNCFNTRSGLNIHVTEGCGCDNDAVTILGRGNCFDCGCDTDNNCGCNNDCNCGCDNNCNCGCNDTTWTDNTTLGTSWTSQRCCTRNRRCDRECDCGCGCE